MAKSKKALGLTSNEAEFVRRYVRTDTKADHVKAFKKCHIEGCDKPEGTPLTCVMNRFLKREDVKFAILTERRRQDMLMLKAHRQADEVTADGIISDAEGLQIIKDTMVLTAAEERQRIKDDPKRSVQGLAKLGSEYGKIIARAGNVDEEVSLEAAKKIMEELTQKDGAPEKVGRNVPVAKQADNTQCERTA